MSMEEDQQMKGKYTSFQIKPLFDFSFVYIYIKDVIIQKHAPMKIVHKFRFVSYLTPISLQKILLRNNQYIYI
jgi:hypothetical protein